MSERAGRDSDITGSIGFEPLEMVPLMSLRIA